MKHRTYKTLCSPNFPVINGLRWVVWTHSTRHTRNRVRLRCEALPWKALASIETPLDEKFGCSWRKHFSPGSTLHPWLAEHEISLLSITLTKNVCHKGVWQCQYSKNNGTLCKFQLLFMATASEHYRVKMVCLPDIQRWWKLIHFAYSSSIRILRSLLLYAYLKRNFHSHLVVCDSYFKVQFFRRAEWWLFMA